MLLNPGHPCMCQNLSGAPESQSVDTPLTEADWHNK